VPGLGTSFGRGGATNFQQDFQQSDCVWIQGSSLVEAHPLGEHPRCVFQILKRHYARYTPEMV
jgi:hypothetical protein